MDTNIVGDYYCVQFDEFLDRLNDVECLHFILNETCDNCKRLHKVQKIKSYNIMRNGQLEEFDCE